jgi:myo-inositol-1(or 4)-monophosphatase
MHDLDRALDVALLAAKGAGQLLLRRLGSLSERDIEHKGVVDLVTVADKESEDFLVDALKSAFSAHAIIAEERGVESSSSGLVWYVDPLDGTTNFVHGLPLFSVSLALYDRLEPLVAVVHAPALAETFSAIRGGGAYSGEVPISVSPVENLIDALVCTGFACVRDGVPANNLANFCRLMERTQGVRRLGSAALDLAYVAAGRFDAFWELHLSPWDLAAGALLVREACGRVTDFLGGDDWLAGKNILASNGRIHETVRGFLDKVEDPGVQSSR